MILLLKITSATGELVQRYHNVRLEEPDPSVFELPPGYRMITASTVTFRFPPRTCLREEVGISGEPPRTTEIRGCN
jgi:hypothetical protein